MAQAIKDKDVRKNCVDVEKVIEDYFHDGKSKDIGMKSEPVNYKKLNKELSRFRSEYNAKYSQELNDINRVKQNLVYRNYEIY